MARGGKRKGAGRKSTGRAVKVALLVRVDPELRALLKRNADRGRRSLSFEVERKLADALLYPRKGETRTRALGYLINQIAAVGRAFEQSGAETEFNWRANRFDFEAFRSAINQVLDRLAPVGEAGDSRYPQAASTEEMGRIIASTVLTLLTTHQNGLYRTMDGDRREPLGGLTYAYPQAARDLDLLQPKKGRQ